MNEPWSKFFWSDYDADEGLRMCSLAAQGLWMRMLCLMARATPKGELRVGGEPCSVSDLSRAVGESEETVAALLHELHRRGVSSTTRAGVIFSRRMRKDAEISRKRAKSGAKGAAVTNGKYGDNQVCRSKTPAKLPAKERPQKPEARDQKERIPQTPTAIKRPPIPDDLRRLMEAAQMTAPPSDIPLLAEWQRHGARFDDHILPAVREVTRSVIDRTGRAPFKLKLFDQAVHAAVAEERRHIEHCREVTERYASGGAR